MVACKYSNFINAEKLVRTKLAVLPQREFLMNFSVANLANKSIILTGGESKKYV